MFNLTGTWRDVFIDKPTRIPQSLTCGDVFFGAIMISVKKRKAV